MDYHKIGAQGNDFIQLLYGDIIETVEDKMDVNTGDIKWGVYFIRQWAIYVIFLKNRIKIWLFKIIFVSLQRRGSSSGRRRRPEKSVSP